jgi:predicted dehydrogenase
VKTSPEVGAFVFSPGRLPLSGMDQAAVDEAGSWLTAILTDSEPLVTARQAAVVTEILDAIYTSAVTGKPVYFTEV